jgi:excinuclease UvrABC ATPase subunit
MNVVAIRCEACEGRGSVEYINCEYDENETVWSSCHVCDGTGYERPPVDHDKQARRIVEGENDENV